MTTPTKNLEFSRTILSDLARLGVREVVLCAGARNASLVTVLSVARGVQTYAFFEERSAAFFALGRMAESGRPVAVITTSGTAAAELLPAVIEADYRALPLIVVTADRPKRYRGSGAPQTIVQPGLFSVYVESVLDVEGAWSTASLNEWSGGRPLHVNVCFDEPLLDGDNAAWTWPEAPSKSPARVTPAGPAPVFAGRRPLVIAGGLNADEAARIKPTLAAWGRPLYLEASSQLRGDPTLRALELTGGDVPGVDYDSVIRVGGVPTLRLWRDLEKAGLPVLHFSDVPLSGLPGGGDVHPLREASNLRADFVAIDSERELARDRAWTALLDDLIAAHPLSEPAWFRRLSGFVPNEAHVFIGNSLPIREWDLCAVRDKTWRTFSNRGTNGIDGLISTFAGVCSTSRPNWCVLGDLSTLYDLTGPWAWRARPVTDVTIAVINNGGGKIFERLFKNPLFENRHDLEFGAWAAMWGLDYHRLTEPGEIGPAPRPRVLEIKPDDAQTAAFWRAWSTKA